MSKPIGYGVTDEGKKVSLGSGKSDEVKQVKYAIYNPPSAASSLGSAKKPSTEGLTSWGGSKDDSTIKPATKSTMPSKTAVAGLKPDLGGNVGWGGQE